MSDRAPAAERPRRAGAEATRARLLQAGRRAFAAKGLAAANLREDILEPAGVSVGSFYHQFRDKTELLLAILDQHSQHFRSRLAEVHRPGPGRTLDDIARQSYAAFLSLAEREAEGLHIQVRERDCEDERVRAFLRADREAWIRSLASDYERLAGPRGPDFDPTLAAQLIVGLCIAALAILVEAPEAERPALRERLLEGLVGFTMHGISGLPTRPTAPTP